MISQNTALLLEAGTFAALALSTIVSVFMAVWSQALGFALLTCMAYYFIQFDLIRSFVKK